MPLEVKWRNGVAQLHGTIDGRRVRRSTKTRDPQVAEIKRIETEARLTKASIYGAETETTFADACLLYLRSKPEDWSGKKYVTPILDHFKTQRIATIKPGHVRKLAADLYPEAKASTRNRCVLKPARAIINFAADARYCQPLWVKGFKEAKVYRDAADRWWIDQFREHAVNPYIKAMALFMWVTAARIGECVIMRPEHLQLDQK